MLYNARRCTNTPSYFKHEKSSNRYFTANDQVAAGLLTEARKQGLRVPEDLAILGFDNHEISKALEISTIEHPGLEMGSHAFSLFHKQIQSEQIIGNAKELSFHLIERDTV